MKTGNFTKKNVTAIEQVVESLKIIRKSAGNDVIIEGEGIYGPAIGYVDLQRVTTDNHPFWYRPVSGIPALGNNLKNDLLSTFLHNKFWFNHRENVILRDFSSPHYYGKRMENNENAVEPILPDEEVKTEITAYVLCGGPMLLTAPMKKLMENKKRFDLISKFLPHYGKGARMVDVFNGKTQPYFYLLPIERDFENWNVLGLINWDDTPGNFEISLFDIIPETVDNYHVFEFWTEKYLGIIKDKIKIDAVAPHGAKLFCLKKNLNRPQLISTNLHLLQGAVDIKTVTYNESERTLVVSVKHFIQKNGKLFIYCPDEYKLKNVSGNAAHISVEQKENLLIVSFDNQGLTELKLEWE